MSYWGIAANTIDWGTIYNESWVGEYIFTKCVGDGIDLAYRVTQAGGTIEAQDCLANNMNKTLK